jgi:hypothetical protein
MIAFYFRNVTRKGAHPDQYLPRPSARTLSVLVTGQYYNLYFSLSYIDIDGVVNVNVELSGEKLNLSILTVVASARTFREMRSDDRFEPIPVNCHCANQCPQLAKAFRTRTEQDADAIPTMAHQRRRSQDP